MFLSIMRGRVCLWLWPTCAVLLSLIRESRCSQFALMNFFSTGLSSCTMNSFLVISIPRSRERISWRMLSRDTSKEMERSVNTVPKETRVSVCVCVYLALPCPQSAAHCGSWSGRGICHRWCWWWSEAVSVSGLWIWSPTAERRQRRLIKGSLVRKIYQKNYLQDPDSAVWSRMLRLSYCCSCSYRRRGWSESRQINVWIWHSFRSCVT